MKIFAITNEPNATTISIKIGYIMLFRIDDFKEIRIQNNTVPPAAIKIYVMNIIIDPTPATML